jgi:hypothetical protein
MASKMRIPVIECGRDASNNRHFSGVYTGFVLFGHKVRPGRMDYCAKIGENCAKGRKIEGLGAITNRSSMLRI